MKYTTSTSTTVTTTTTTTTTSTPTTATTTTATTTYTNSLIIKGDVVVSYCICFIHLPPPPPPLISRPGQHDRSEKCSFYIMAFKENILISNIIDVVCCSLSLLENNPDTTSAKPMLSRTLHIATCPWDLSIWLIVAVLDMMRQRRTDECKVIKKGVLSVWAPIHPSLQLSSLLTYSLENTQTKIKNTQGFVLFGCLVS